MEKIRRTRKTYTEAELAFRTELSSKLAQIDGKIDNLHDKLTPILELRAEVTEHDRQIYLWKGVNSALSAVFVLILGVASTLYAKMRHWM